MAHRVVEIELTSGSKISFMDSQDPPNQVPGQSCMLSSLDDKSPRSHFQSSEWPARPAAADHAQPF